MTTTATAPYPSSIDSSSIRVGGGGSDSQSLSSSHPILNRNNTSQTTNTNSASIYRPSAQQVAASAPTIDIPKGEITAAAIGFGTFGSDVHLVNASGGQDIYPRIWYFSKLLVQSDQNTSAGDEWDWEVKLIEVKQDKLPFIIRRSKAQKAYEIVSLQDGSKSLCRGIKVASSISLKGTSTKISFEGLDNKTWVWKGNFNRGMVLSQVEVDENGKKVKTVLAEYIRYSSRPILTIQDTPQAQRDPSLIVASFYPLIDLHREDFKRKYNWPGDSEIGEALPAKWDSKIIMLGEKDKGEKMAQEERERESERSQGQYQDVATLSNGNGGGSGRGSFETERSNDTKRAGSSR